jgi:hypothetical protein
MPQGHIDHYTRIEIFLPFKTQAEIQAGRDVIDYVQNARGRGGRYRYGGMTHSAQLPTVFQGVWRDTKRGKWVIDRLVILTVDVDILFDDRPQVTQEANSLKSRTAQFYISAQAPQKDIWVVVYAIGHVQ